MLGLSVLSVVACNDDNDSLGGKGGSAQGGGGIGGSHAGKGGSGDKGGEAHSGEGPGALGGGGAGGAGGDHHLGGAGGEFSGARDTCGPYSLDEYCDANPTRCPSSPDEFPREFECRYRFESVERFATLCGGTLVAVGDHFVSEDYWTFDSAGHLQGLVRTTDVVSECPEGGYSATVTYGSPCSPEGEFEDLCPDGAGGAGGAGGGRG